MYICISYSVEKTHKRINKKRTTKEETHTREHAKYTFFFKLTYNYRVITVEW